MLNRQLIKVENFGDGEVMHLVRKGIEVNVNGEGIIKGGVIGVAKGLIPHPAVDGEIFKGELVQDADIDFMGVSKQILLKDLLGKVFIGGASYFSYKSNHASKAQNPGIYKFHCGLHLRIEALKKMRKEGDKGGMQIACILIQEGDMIMAKLRNIGLVGVSDLYPRNLRRRILRSGQDVGVI